MTNEEAKRNLIYAKRWGVKPDDEALNMAIKALEQEPCDDVCEWFEQYVDIATDIVELRFSDGTVKRAKRGTYVRDIEKSIRKMLIDQIANEKKQEPEWIPVSERLPEDAQTVLVTRACRRNRRRRRFVETGEIISGTWISPSDEYRIEVDSYTVIAWMPLPAPFRAESEDKE